MNDDYCIAVIGGGAAGFFSAIRAKTLFPKYRVVLLESSNKVLSKVKVSGGGRCNVTHACFQNSKLIGFYPRGAKLLKSLFERFNTTSTFNWFVAHKVNLKIEADNRVFPVSNSSQTIIDCLTIQAQKSGVEVWLSSKVTAVKPVLNGFNIEISKNQTQHFNKVIVATGGHSKLDSYNWLKELGHQIVSPVPSLFTFNMPKDAICHLMGVVANNALVRIQGSKYQSDGPLLITHWGMSGPAVLKLSAIAARELNESNYHFKIQINWINESNEEQVRDFLTKSIAEHPKALLRNRVKFDIPSRLWCFLMNKVEILPELNWEDLHPKMLNRFVNVLLNDVYLVDGKTTFKEEFVTCGGVSLNSVSKNTLQSKVCPGMYFAGEILDIDGVTGGFNFQAAWTTGYVAGELGE